MMLPSRLCQATMHAWSAAAFVNQVVLGFSLSCVLINPRTYICSSANCCKSLQESLPQKRGKHTQIFFCHNPNDVINKIASYIHRHAARQAICDRRVYQSMWYNRKFAQYFVLLWSTVRPLHQPGLTPPSGAAFWRL